MNFDYWILFSILLKSAFYASALLASGGMIFYLLFSKHAPELQLTLYRMIISGAQVAVIIAILSFLIEAGRLADNGLSGMFQTDILNSLWAQNIGDQTLLIMAGLISLLLGLVFRDLFSAVFGLLGIALISYSFLVSESNADKSNSLIRALLFVHIILIAFWYGALPALRSAARGQMDIIYAANLAKKFSYSAMAAIFILCITGIIIALSQVNSVYELFDTTYGRLLCFKIIFVIFLLTLALVNRSRLVSKMQDGNYSAAAQYSSSISIELMLAVCVFIITAILTTTMKPSIALGINHL